MFNFPPEREFVTLIIDVASMINVVAWGHHNGARSSGDKFDMRTTVKKIFLTSPPSPATSTPGGASHPIPQGDPYEQELGSGRRPRGRAVPSGKCEKIINVLATMQKQPLRGRGLRPPAQPIRKWGSLRVTPVGRPRGLPNNKLILVQL